MGGGETGECIENNKNIFSLFLNIGALKFPRDHKKSSHCVEVCRILFPAS